MREVCNVCPMCHTLSSVKITDEEEKGLEQFVKGEKHLQDALPNTSAPVREFLHTGLCSKCQLDIFGNTDERIERKRG